MSGRKEKKKVTTCCKNTVNSTAECAEGVCGYWVVRQKQTAPLTFSDLCVESGTVGIGVGGWRGRRPPLSGTGRSVLKTYRRLHRVPLSPPLSQSPFCLSGNSLFGSGWRLAQRLSVGEVCLSGGAGNAPLPLWWSAVWLFAVRPG